MKKYISVPFILCTMLCSISMAGQWVGAIDQYFEHITMENGLSSNMIRDVVQDEAGFIWIATSNGLNRYDGKNIHVFRRDESTANSLSHNHISKLLIDSKGTLWVGTMQGGLCRFREDGTFDVFKYDKNDSTSLNDNQVWSIFEDSKSNLWVGTQTGLNLFNHQTETFERFTHQPKDSTSLPVGSILAIMEDHAGRIWVGGWAIGINLLIPAGTIPGRDKISFSRITAHEGLQLGNNNAWTLCTDYTGRLWAGMYGGGVYYMSPPDCPDYYTCPPEKFSFTQIQHHPIASDNDGLVMSLFSNDTSLYIGYEMGLSRLDINTLNKNKTVQLTSFNFTGSNIIGTTNSHVNKVYKDKNGLLWIASNKGLYKYFGDQLKFEKKLHDFCVDNRLSILSLLAFDKGKKVWIGTSKKGVFIYDSVSEKIQGINYISPEGYELKQISSLHLDSEGVIWAGSWEGNLFSIHNHTERPLVKYHPIPFLNGKLNGSNIWKITPNKDGRFWLATQQGLLLYNTLSGDYDIYTDDKTPNSIVHGDNIFDIVSYKDDYFMATAGGGLHRLSWVKDSLTSYFYAPDSTSTNPIKSNIVFDLELIGDELWIGSLSGIQKYNIAEDSFYRISTLDKYINGRVLSMTQDKSQHIWFTTNDGLFCYKEETNLLSRYIVNEGLPQNFEFRASFTAADGRAYLGGIDGFIDFNGTAFTSFHEYNTVKITNFKIDNKSVKVGEKDPHLNAPVLTKNIINTPSITLAPEHNVITIAYSVFDYVAPHQYEYTYRLEGFDEAEKWNFSGKETNVTYTNLPSGEYTFQVRARSKAGTWTPVKTLKIKVLKPFWQKWWFIGLCIFSALLLIYLYLKYREYHIRQQNIELESLVKERTLALHQNVEELQRNKTTLQEKNIELEELVHSNSELQQFAHAVSHDLKQPIRTISSFAGLLERNLNKKGVLDDSDKEYIDFIKKGTDNMNQLVSGLLAYAKVGSRKADKHSKFSFEEIILIVNNNLNRQIIENNAKIKYPNKNIQIDGVKVKLVQLFQNLISNSIKFRQTDIPPIIDIKIEEQEKFWTFQLSDNGVGIPKASRPKVFQIFKRAHANYEGSGIGLATCKRIIEQHGGEIWVDMDCESGTTFHFYIEKNTPEPIYKKPDSNQIPSKAL